MTSRHAYLITAYHNFSVLEELLGLVDDPRNAVFVHVDKKSGPIDRARLTRLCRHSSVTFVDRVTVYWGDFSQITSVLALFRAAVGGRYDYYHLLSGSDLPLHPQDEIHDFFSAHAGEEFVGFAASFDPEWVTAVHLFNRFMVPRNRFQRILYRRVSGGFVALQRRLGTDHSRRFGLTLRKGSDWFSVTHALATHLLANERTLRRLLRHAHVPTEFYLQTLVWNSDFRERLHDVSDEFAGSARLIDWERGAPYTFVSADLDELTASERMFARKFDENVDRQVVDRLVAHLRRRESEAPSRGSG